MKSSRALSPRSGIWSRTLRNGFGQDGHGDLDPRRIGIPFFSRIPHATPILSSPGFLLTPMAKGSPIRLTGARICVRAVWNFFRLLALHGGRNSLPRAPVRLFSQGCHRTDISWFRNPKGLYPTFFTLLSPLIQENSFGLAGLPGSKGDMPAIGLCRNPFSLV